MIPQELINEYKLHKITIYDIAKSVDKSITTVYYELKKLGIETNYYRIISKERNQKIIKCYKEGMRPKDIIQKFAISRPRFYQIIKKYSN